MGPQILDAAALIVVPRDLGRRSILEIRRVDLGSEIVQNVKIGGRYLASWWDNQEGLVVLSSQASNFKTCTLSRIDMEKGRVTRKLSWNLPYSNFHRLNETATLLQHSDLPGSVITEIYQVRFGSAPKKLLSKGPLKLTGQFYSRNGQFLAAHCQPESPYHYLFDVAESRAKASFEAPNELPLAISGNGRYYLTSLERWEGAKFSSKLILRDFGGETKDSSQSAAAPLTSEK